MNRLAIINKVTNARDSKSYRNEIDFKLIKKYENRPQCSRDLQLSARTNPFGVANRPSTPIKNVLEGHYELIASPTNSTQNIFVSSISFNFIFARRNPQKVLDDHEKQKLIY